MYSVQDLLISHGYKPARDLTARREDDPEGRRHRRARPRDAQGLLNGYEHGPAAPEHGKASVGRTQASDSESRRSTPRGHRARPAACAARPEAGFSDQPALAWSSQPQPGREQARGRRGGPEAGDAQRRRGRQDPEGRGMAQAHGVHMREGPWEVGRRMEDVMKKASWEEELMALGPARWQDAGAEGWGQPGRLGRQMSDGGGKKLFQDLYPFIQGECMLTAQNKKKSRSLPRVLSPEGLSHVQVPIPLSDGCARRLPKMPSYPPNCAPHLESTRNPEKERGGTSAPFPRPKFGRPVKPPSYGSHQQGRGGEGGDFPVSRQPGLHSPCPARAQETRPRHERGVSDSGLEPPGYVPPPSYRSPPLHIPNPYLEDTAPRPVEGGHGRQEHLPETAGAARPPPSGVLGPPWEPPPHSRPVAARESCVQYIPFDDPRIRHIKLAQPPGFCEEAKLADGPHRGPALGKLQPDGLPHPQGPPPPSGSRRGPASADPSPPWLWGPLLPDGENGGFPDQRDHCHGRGQPADARGDLQGPEEGQVPLASPQDERTWETQTELRKFEPGIQTKKTSKKKTSETIFCLVSIPVKSEPHLPDTDRNNNALKQGADKKALAAGGAALQEQALLSMSSTDLELQTLMGGMVGRAELAKDPREPGEDREVPDLRFLQLSRQSALQWAGSWPGLQYRDQQTQTSFPEEPGSAQLLPGAEAPAPSSDPAASKAPVPLAVAASTPNLRRHASLSPTSSRAFARPSTSTSPAAVPEARQSQPWADGRGPGAQPAPKPEVVKGEATAGPCNSQQPFGQFLLKPVSRRPWDLISQLESFNKELQEEEGSHEGPSSSSSSSSSEDSETEEEQPPAHARSAPPAWGGPGVSPGAGARPPPCTEVLEDPDFQSGRVQSQAESQRPLGASSQPPHPLQVEDGTGDWFPSAEESPIPERGRREFVSGLKALSPGPLKRTVPLGPSGTEREPRSCAEPRAPPEGPASPRALGSAQLNQRVSPQDGGAEKAAEAPLSLSGKARGLSAPDLRSVGLMKGQEQGASELDRDGAEGRATDIPVSESLQDRAARILGIEVAMESLLPGTGGAGQSQPPEPQASAWSPARPRAELAPPGGPADTPDAFYGRRKCGWTQSRLFVGERAPQAPELPDEDGVLASPSPSPSPATSPEPAPNPSDSPACEPLDTAGRPPFRSTLLHFVERTPGLAGSEKRLRSPSKAIESLQERLASPPRRADPERLMRMKEVSSVSRMRCLSAMGSEAAEEAEEPRATRGQARQQGGLVSPGSAGRAWRAGHAPAISRDASSWEENGHQAAQREQKSVDGGLWGPDSYDPSRVERV